MRRFGLIGYPLGHSFSKAYFTEKFAREKIADCVYENYPLSDINEFNGFLHQCPDLAGLNVTIPYKEKIIPFLDVLDPVAREVKAVNTVAVIRKGNSRVLEGYNTDVYGFEISLLKHLKPWHTYALVLGTGGASKAVVWVLEKIGINYRFVSRTPQKGMLTYNELDRTIMSEHLLIINCTPVGMYPDSQQAPPLPYEHLTSRHLLYDLIYNPEKTLFLSYAEKAGADFCNGLEMLILQAEKSWEIWNRKINSAGNL